MILLDTNVLSELMRPAPADAVLRWLDGQPPDGLATTTLCVAELGAGLAVLPAGARQQDLRARAATLLSQGFVGRIYGFDLDAAAAYGDLLAMRRRAGLSASGFDLLIAAIAHTRNLTVATRNIGDFEGCGLRLLNPWDDPTPAPAPALA